MLRNSGSLQEGEKLQGVFANNFSGGLACQLLHERIPTQNLQIATMNDDALFGSGDDLLVQLGCSVQSVFRPFEFDPVDLQFMRQLLRIIHRYLRGPAPRHARRSSGACAKSFERGGMLAVRVHAAACFLVRREGSPASRLARTSSRAGRILPGAAAGNALMAASSRKSVDERWANLIGTLDLDVFPRTELPMRSLFFSPTIIPDRFTDFPNEQIRV